MITELGGGIKADEHGYNVIKKLENLKTQIEMKKVME